MNGIHAVTIVQISYLLSNVLLQFQSTISSSPYLTLQREKVGYPERIRQEGSSHRTLATAPGCILHLAVKYPGRRAVAILYEA